MLYYLLFFFSVPPLAAALLQSGRTAGPRETSPRRWVCPGGRHFSRNTESYNIWANASFSDPPRAASHVCGHSASVGKFFRVVRDEPAPKPSW